MRANRSETLKSNLGGNLWNLAGLAPNLSGILWNVGGFAPNLGGRDFGGARLETLVRTAWTIVRTRILEAWACRSLQAPGGAWSS